MPEYTPGFSNSSGPLPRRSGVAAARPAASAFGEGYWYSTDTASEDYSNGTTWVTGVGGGGGGTDAVARAGLTSSVNATIATTAAAPTVSKLNGYNCTSGPLAPTIPLASSVAAGTTIGFWKVDSTANVLTPTCSGSDHINGLVPTTAASLSLGNQRDWFTSDGVSLWTATSGLKSTSSLATVASYSGIVRHPLTGMYHMAGTCDRTGAVDCSTAFQTLVNAVSAAGGGTIYADPGIYQVGTPILWPQAGVSLLGGAGRGATVFDARTTAQAMIHRLVLDGASVSSPTQDCSFKSFTIDGTNQPGSTYDVKTKGIGFEWTLRVEFDSLYIHDTVATGLGIDNLLAGTHITTCDVRNCGRLNDGTNSGGNGIGIGSATTTDTEAFIVANCTAINNKRYNIFIESQVLATGAAQTSGGQVTGCFTSGGQVGIGNTGNRRFLIANNQCTASTVAGIQVALGTWANSQPGYEGIITGNICWGQVACPGILLDYRGRTINGKYFVHGNECSFNGAEGIAVVSDTQDMAALNIIDNNCHDNAQTGIRVGYVTGGTNTASLLQSEIRGNICNNNGTISTANNGDGIRVQCPMVDVAIDYNRCYDRQTTKTQVNGLVFNTAATTTGGSIRGNKLRNNKTNGFSVSSTISTTTVVSGNEGMINHPAPTAPSVTASPMTYTAPLFPTWLAINGGTVSAITVAGATMPPTAQLLLLEAGDAVVITYSAAPTLVQRSR